LPNRSKITATHTCLVNIPALPPSARQAHKFSELAHALISVGLLCDHGCRAIFDSTTVEIWYQDTVILRGHRDPITKLWTIPLTADPHPAINHYSPSFEHQAFSAYHTSNQTELVTFLHAACGSPVPSTWIKAIDNGHFATWPGLTSDLIRKLLPKSLATVKGHLNQQRKNIRSTQPKSVPNSDEQPISDSPNERTHHVFAAVHDTTTGQISTDLTGRFPTTSSRGNKYILVLYDYDSNAILTEPMQNRSDKEHLRAYNKLHLYLVDRGFKPLLQKLDNEASIALKRTIRAKGIDFQLVPPHNHRRNAAERAIQTFKNHFVACLCTADQHFPMHLWDRILPQATTTLNLLRASRLNPRLSAHEQLNGTFDFNRTPLAPLGTRVVLHEKPAQRRSWDPHGQDGWYIGHAPEHYRCYQVYVTKTAGTRISDTVEFFPRATSMPRTSSADAATFAAQALVEALAHPAPAAPFALLGDLQQQALQKLAAIFNQAVNPSSPAPPASPSPRVDSPSQRVHPSPPPRVPTAHTHRYPTRHSLTNHLANHVATVSTSTPALLTPATAQIDLPKHFAYAVVDPDTGVSMEYKQLMQHPKTKSKWTHSFANELGRLAQGVGDRLKGTETIFFIPVSAVPKDRKVTYGRIVVSIRPQKDEVERTRLTVGGNLIEYPGDVSTKTADLTTAKIHFNSVLSTPGAKFMGIDLKNFYLNTPMDRYEYMRLPIAIIPDEIIEQYQLLPLVHNGHVYIEIRKGMYGLPQAGILANKLLTKRLARHGYAPTVHTPGLWKHHTRPISFTLVVDDFGVKYVDKVNADHLYSALIEHYEASTDWEGKLYCGVTLKWDYQKRTVELSMPGYVAAALHKFQHPAPRQPCHAPSAWNKPQYGVKIQMTSPLDTTPSLTDNQTKRLQKVVGTFLFYARAVDGTMLHALNALAAAQKNGTQATAQALVHFLNYCATHPDATICYRASDMILHIHSDASYLTEPEARSRAGGHHYLGDKNSHTKPPSNGAILAIAKILRHVLSSAAEAEVGALFLNGQDGVILRTTLEEMGHPQPATPIQVDNSTANGIIHGTVKQQRSRTMDMRFYWIRDRAQQGQFLVFWAPGADNVADYYTKHHSPAHHRIMRPTILHEPNSVHTRIQRGCVDSPRDPKVTRRLVRPPTVRPQDPSIPAMTTSQPTTIN
jgi:hypothetical protein